MENKEKICDAERTRLFTLIKAQKQFRTGVVFPSRMNNYFYDSGTGKIIQLGDLEYRLMNAIFNLEATPETLAAAMHNENSDAVNTFLYETCRMKLMRIPEITHLECDAREEICAQLDNEVVQLVLEITQQCNFRCTYCIYNSDFGGNHDFTSSEMNWSVAKASIDYLFSHSKNNKKVYITFYGGEPLLKFDLIKQCVEYAQSKSTKQELYYNLTTNLSLMTQEIADYFASVPGFSLTVSLDGPEESHSNRVYANGKPTFQDAMRGMEYLCRAFGASNKSLSISSVLTPPFNFEKLDAVNSFFEDLPNLPQHTSVTITYPSDGTFNTEEYAKGIYNNPRYWELGAFDPLYKWQRTQAIRNSLSWENSSNIYSRALIEDMVRIKNRFASSEPAIRGDCIGACCVPGVRKLYVHPDGEFSICERIGTSPSIGNVKDGVDKESLLKYYIDDYLKASEKSCSNCWAFNICPVCYALCFGKEGVDVKRKASVCEKCRTSVYTSLSTFCTIQEERPDAMDAVSLTRLF